VLSTPVPEIASLRTVTQSWDDLTLDSSATQRLLAEVTANTYEIEAVVDVGQATRFGFRLRTAPDGRSAGEVGYDASAGELDGAALSPRDGRITLRLLVDRGQLEVFGNDGEVYQSHNVDFDSLPGGRGVELFTDGRLHLESLRLHHLSSIWND
jgi:levanase/fructan beta-fructosidase